MTRLVLALTLLLGLASGAHATCPVPNPNLLGPPFVDNCPLPASVLDSVLFAGNITVPLSQTISQSGTALGPVFPNSFQINPDTLAVPGLAFMTGWTFSDYFGGSTVTGGRQAIEGFVNQTAVTSSTNGFRDYVGGTFLAQTNTGDGGTNLTSDPRGNYFGINPYFNLIAGATNVGLATAGEANSIAQVGTTVKFKSIWNLVGGGGDAVQGSTWDTMLVFSNQTSSVLHKSAILIGDMHGEWPIDPGGSILTVSNLVTSAAMTAANGIDFGAVSFSTCTFHSAAFSVCIHSVDVDMNTAGIYPSSSATTYSFTDNFSNGSKEVAIWNDDTTASLSFVLYQKTGASAATAVFQASTTNITVPSIVTTATPTQAHASGNACLGITAGGVIYASSTITTC